MIKVKIKSSKKELENAYDYIISVNYCKLQSLLIYKDPDFYCSNACGWACDVYRIEVDDKIVLISTGYAPLKSKNSKIDDVIISFYEDKSSQARILLQDIGCTYEQTKAFYDLLIDNLIRTVII